MPKINDIHSIIVPATQPNFTAHTYSEIYGGGTTGCTMTVNGVYVEVTASSSLSLWVRSVSGGAGCWLLGEKKDVYLGSPTF
jgi:hypothetical protein